MKDDCVNLFITALSHKPIRCYEEVRMLKLCWPQWPFMLTLFWRRQHKTEMWSCGSRKLLKRPAVGPGRCEQGRGSAACRQDTCNHAFTLSCFPFKPKFVCVSVTPLPSQWLEKSSMWGRKKKATHEYKHRQTFVTCNTWTGFCTTT